MLRTYTLSSGRSGSFSSYAAIYAAAVLALASVYYLPGLTGALLGVSIWAFGLVPLVRLVHDHWFNPEPSPSR